MKQLQLISGTGPCGAPKEVLLAAIAESALPAL